MSTYLGQNFLKDSSIIKFIVQNISSLYTALGAKALIEIGPGKGALTKKISGISQSFFVIEKDVTMQKYLEAIDLSSEQIVFGDVLEQNFGNILSQVSLEEKDTIVVGNLPYYITSPIFKHLFWQETPKVLGGFFMIQNEVGEKIKSDAKKKSYLWWLLNRSYNVEYVKMVPAKAFSPAPKVKSCLVRFTLKDPENVEWHELEKFLNYFSPYSRKTLGKIMKMVNKKSEVQYSVPDSLKGKRLEELSWIDVENLLAFSKEEREKKINIAK